MSSCTNINVSDLDEETNKKLKGDVIGDTLYSQSFVLKTLLKFSNVEWNEEFEQDLCFLWDMTVEKEVCDYLFEIDYPSLVYAAIEKCSEPRFTEIVIGILANILSVDCKNKIISDEQVDSILNILDSSDPLILIQVMRFITALAHSVPEKCLIEEKHMNKIKFILHNSINQELLQRTIESVAKLTLDFKLNDKLVDLALFKAVLNAHCTIFVNDNEFLLDCKEKVNVCKYTLEVISNICSYTENFEDYELLVALERNSELYVTEVLKILEYFSCSENLLPVSNETVFFLSVFRYTLITLNINFSGSLFKVLCKIYLIIEDIQNEVTDIFDSIVELLCFLVSCDHNEEYIGIVKKIQKNKGKSIFRCLKDNKHKYPI